MPTVLFLCTGNSARSQIAEAIVNSSFPEWRASSAGSRPAGFVHPQAIAVLAELGIRHVGRSKGIDELPSRDFDLVVTVCDDAAEACPVWPGRAGRRVHRGFQDPAKVEGSEDQKLAAFRQVRDDMRRELPGLLRLA